MVGATEEKVVGARGVQVLAIEAGTIRAKVALRILQPDILMLEIQFFRASSLRVTRFSLNGAIFST